MRLAVSESSTGVRVRWGGRTLARGRSTRFSDDDILRILRAAEAGMKVADLCAAENVPAKTYYQWKVKYGDLEPEEMKRRRRRERSYRRSGFLAAALVLAGLVYAAVLARPEPNQTPAPANRPPAPARRTTAAQLPPAPSRPAAPPPAAAKPQAVAPPPSAAPPASRNPLDVPARVASQPVRPEAVAPRTARPVDAPDVKASEPAGYAIQVAAVRDLGEARQLTGRLTAAGYVAYVTRTITGEREMYRVRVGPFESREVAETALDRLAGDGYRGAWIAR